MSRTARVLRKLDLLPVAEDGVQRLRVCEQCPLDVFIGIRRPDGAPVLQLELKAAHVLPVDSLHSKGLSIDGQLIGKTSADGVRYTLALADPHAADLFVLVSDDLLEVIDAEDSQKAAMSAFIARLRHWSDFFSKRALPGLTAEEQQGLFGEVWTIREMLAPYGASQSVDSWTGPQGANQDFQWHDRALEIKTTSANPSVSVTVSNVKQLDDAVLGRISLIVIELDRIANGQLTLPVMVESTRVRLAGSDAGSAMEFADKVAAAGYSEVHADQYAHVGYAVRRARVFGVADGFPRLRVDDLPEGVGNVRYRIDVAALSPFEVDADSEILDFMKGLTDDRSR